MKSASTAESTSAVRQRFLARVSKNEDLYDECDIKMVTENDWWVRRFIEYQNEDEEKALNQLDEAMKWRKSFGVNTRTLERDCPKEIFQIGALFIYNHDVNGNPIIYLRIKCNRKIPKLMPALQQYFVALVERIESNSQRFVLFFDFTGAGLSNANLDLLSFIVSTLKNYFPLGVDYVVCYKFPWIFKSLWSIVKLWVGERQKIIKFVDADELRNYVDDDQLPKYLGGSCKKSFIETPENSPSVYEVCHLYGFDKDEVTTLIEKHQFMLDEAKQLNS